MLSSCVYGKYSPNTVKGARIGTEVFELIHNSIETVINEYHEYMDESKIKSTLSTSIPSYDHVHMGSCRSKEGLFDRP